MNYIKIELKKKIILKFCAHILSKVIIYKYRNVIENDNVFENDKRGINMDYKIFESMMNPIRMKIIQAIIKNERATTKDIAKECGEVPQATLYRNINRLIKDNIIIVESENKVRGVMEKVYKINIDPFEEIENIAKENNKEKVLNLFYNFMMTLMKDFESYSKREEINILEDIVGFRSYPVYLTDEEAKEMMLEIRESIFKRVENKKTEDRKLRKLSTVFVPINEE